MARLASVPQLRSVKPVGYLPFASFSCGGNTAYEHEVDDLVGHLYRGGFPESEDVRVAEDSETRSLIGLCVVQRRVFYAADDAYIALIAISTASRGRRLPDGTRLGSLLLGDALMQIKRLWRGPPMPPVGAIIASANTASHKLFDEWGFDYVPADSDGKYDLRYRERGLGLIPSKG